jgi:HNH endonuclease
MINEQRFWSYVQKASDAECWEWRGSVNNKGYGRLPERRGPGVRKAVIAHRLAYQFGVGPIPEGQCVLHRCDNRKCCNPQHLFIGTIADNNRDMWIKGRGKAPNLGKQICKNGHPLTAANVRLVKGGRRCWPCFLEWQRNYRAGLAGR